MTPEDVQASQHNYSALWDQSHSSDCQDAITQRLFPVHCHFNYDINVAPPNCSDEVRANYCTGEV